MEIDSPPPVLYYATVTFEDGSVETPHYLVFDRMAEGVITIKDHYRDIERSVEAIVMKELEFVESRVVSEDTHILIPSNDFGVDDDFRDIEAHEEMIQIAESVEPGDALLGILPYEQDNDRLLCRAFYMGPFLPVKTVNDYVEHLEEDPFTVSQPVDYLWMYRPTGAWNEVGEREETVN